MLTLVALFASINVATADAPECSRWNGAGAAPAVTQDTTCINDPPIGTFDPVVEWAWSGTTGLSTNYTKVMATPAVANLTDDNNDGRIDENDIPDIVFTAYKNNTAYRDAGAVVAISGDGSGVLWALESIGGYKPNGAGGVAIGDLDNDGKPDVCVSGEEASIICMEGSGAFKFVGWGSEPYVYGWPALADMDHDGKTEIVFGNQIFDNKGNLLGEGLWGDGRNFMSVPVDWDGDGILDVVAGNAVYRMDGSVLEFIGKGGTPNSQYEDDALPAIGDFDGDGKPDIVKVTWGEVVLIDNDGTEKWRRTVPGGGNGGAPTVADFDGDGEPEVGVAGYAKYGVFDTDGSILWERNVTDQSSSVTGSSVFDFEGDGISEVVYADEFTLWVFSGPDGDVLMEEKGHGSATLYENPVIADVDNDGATEIVIVSNGYGGAAWTGVTVIGDQNDSWAAARPIWNQHQYHITNVNNDGSIPRYQADNWLTWNNFRAGGTELGPSDWLPQLTLDDADVCATECNDKRIEVYVPIINEGLLDAANVEIGFYKDGGGVPVLSKTYSAHYIAGGTATVVGPILFDKTEWGTGDLIAIVDHLEVAEECDETDNEVNLGAWPYPTVDLDNDGYEDDDCGGTDCNDTDPNINPSMEDIGGNGVDEDCDGDDDERNDCDDDLDGHQKAECGGEDCDDNDASVNPGALDIPEDGIDQDCDGYDQIDRSGGDLNQKCGCAAQPTGGSFGGLLLIGLLGMVRRRR